MKETMKYWFQLQGTKSDVLQKQLKYKIYGLTKEEQAQALKEESDLIKDYTVKWEKKQKRKRQRKSKSKTKRKTKSNSSKSKREMDETSSSESETETATETELKQELELESGDEKEREAIKKTKLLTKINLPPTLLIDPKFEYQKQRIKCQNIKKYLRWCCLKCHPKYRVNLWGVFLPGISYRKWLNSSYLEIIKINNDMVQYIRLPFFRSGASIDEYIIEFCDLLSHEVKTEDYGINNLDGMTSWGRSHHQQYQYSSTALFVHPYDRQKQHGDDINDLTSGKLIHLKPAWTGGKYDTRLNTYYNPRYLLAWWLNCYLEGIGSNGPETIHKWIKDNASFIKHVFGFDTYIDNEMILRFSKNFVRLKNLKKQIEEKYGLNKNKNKEKNKNKNQNEINKKKKTKKTYELDKNWPNQEESKWILNLHKISSGIYSLSDLQKDGYGHGILQFKFSNNKNDYIHNFNENECVVKTSGINKQHRSYIRLFVLKELNENGQLELTNELINTLSAEFDNKYDSKTLRRFLKQQYKIINNNMYF